ncbi:MAG TPA: chemotaxis protein CheX [Thermotogota bacterium]|jgi:chemotaxis protein CheX|nr:chemotaxis protein CheX [Thermotogota bacterium]NLH19298.1 chemotaxis protein CheX [Thermotogaceae bacterium]OQC32439.1 MAG: CheY-P phosphatase CheX [Thermotogota bacterium ADurb.Bin062]HNW45778.1 chemotaxis protein CheX [Thermotogota bacterium]HNY81309.1 chemotaxis protein CheX [Thermotogota bacterium]
MDVRIINSILKSTVKIFTEAVNMKIEFEKPQIAKELAKGYDLVTLVGFNGSLSGNLVYAFDTQVALSVVQKMMGMPYNQLDELAMSAIGELANMISGNIATNMEQIGKPIDITPPSVILGKEIRVNVDGVILKIITKYEDKTFEVDMVLRE